MIQNKLRPFGYWLPAANCGLLLLGDGWHAEAANAFSVPKSSTHPTHLMMVKPHQERPSTVRMVAKPSLLARCHTLLPRGSRQS